VAEVVAEQVRFLDKAKDSGSGERFSNSDNLDDIPF